MESRTSFGWIPAFAAPPLGSVNCSRNHEDAYDAGRGEAGGRVSGAFLSNRPGYAANFEGLSLVLWSSGWWQQRPSKAEFFKTWQHVRETSLQMAICGTRGVEANTVVSVLDVLQHEAPR